MKIGLLSVQGDFERHQTVLNNLAVENILVKNKPQLWNCDGLIIPGGESTTISKLLLENGLYDDIRKYSENRQIFGTCAGAIILAKNEISHKIKTLGLIDIDIERNAYGRQIDSFIGKVNIYLNGKVDDSYEGVFIRAPKIKRVGESVKKLAIQGQDVVMAENQNILVATFHPELTNDSRIHQYFLEKIRNS